MSSALDFSAVMLIVGCAAAYLFRRFLPAAKAGKSCGTACPSCFQKQVLRKIKHR